MAKVRVVRGAVRLPDAPTVADAGPAKVRERVAWAESIRKEKRREDFPSLIAVADWYVVVRLITAWRYRDGD